MGPAMLLIPLLVLEAGSASVETPLENVALVRAKQLYLGLQFDASLAKADAAFRFPNSRQALIELYELRGLALSALGRYKKARATYSRLLMLAPDHALPDYVAPRMRRPLDEARAGNSDKGSIRATTRAPSAVSSGDGVSVEVRLDNDPLGMVDRFRINYRVNNGGKHSGILRTEVAAGASSVVALKANGDVDQPKGTVAYWCELLDEHGGVLVMLGSEQAPFSVAWQTRPVYAAGAPGQGLGMRNGPPSPPVPFYRTGWFISGSGVIVLSTLVATLYAVWPKPAECVATNCREALKP